MQGTLTFLGTGASAGIPVIGCKCSTCTSSLPFNRRLRPSALITVADKTFLIDVGPDFRAQALLYKITTLNGLLLTHTHYDHIAGLDDLRVYNFRQKAPLPCLLSRESFEELKVRYYYLIQPRAKEASLCAQLKFQVLPAEEGEVDFEGITWRYIHYLQGGMKVTGFRLGTLAYVSDIKQYPETIFKELQGTEKLILSVVKQDHSEMHFTLKEGVEFARKVGAKQTWFTHIGHDLEHETTNKQLPSDISLSYDGLQIAFDVPK